MTEPGSAPVLTDDFEEPKAGEGEVLIEVETASLGAGRVVGAARNAKALARLTERGIADDVVQLGGDDDAGALKEAAGDGFDVVLDGVYGEPFVAALKATRFGARIMTIGIQAGTDANLHIPDLLFRTHTLVGTGQRLPADRQAIWSRLLDIARTDGIDVDYARYTLEQAPAAWAAMADSPHAKVVATIDPTPGRIGAEPS